MEHHEVEFIELFIFQILPEVVWLLIFEYLHRFPDTLEAVSNSSLVLRSLVVPNRFLLAKVLPLLEKEFDSQQTQPDLPQNSSLIKTILAKCRAVCGNWCHAVDKLAQSCHPHDRSTFVTRLSLLERETEDPEVDFLLNFENSHNADCDRSPFVGNSVSFLHTKIPDNYYQNSCPFSRVLSRFGHHIRFCELKLIASSYFQYWPMQALCDVLRAMPNAEELALHLKVTYWTYVYPSTSTEFSLTPHGALRRLYTRGVKANFLETVLLMLPNLEYLDFGYNFWYEGSPQNCRDPILPELPAGLRHLGVELIKYHPTVLGKQPPNQCEIFHWTLDYFAAHGGSLIQSLELSIACENSAVWYEWRRTPFSFPHLTNLKLKSRNFPCIDIVMRAKDSLEYLTVEINAEERLAEWKRRPESTELVDDEKVKFLSCYDNMNKSNIWKLVPKLKRVTVHERPTCSQRFRERIWNRKA